MKNLLKILLMVLLCGCSETVMEQDEPTLPAPQGADGGSKAMYLKLSVKIPQASGSRANPTGGEYGDGEEVGTDYEGAIFDMTIFVYADALGVGLNSPADTPIVYSRYVRSSELTVINATSVGATLRLDYYAYAAGHRLAVVVNGGDLTDKVSTLGALRDMPMQAWTPGVIPSACRRFVMASASNVYPDGCVTRVREGKGSYEEPNLSAETVVERLAARIDLMVNDEQLASGKWVDYPVSGAAEHPANLRLTDILPVNMMSRPTYMLKHVSYDTDDLTQTGICGIETMDGNVPTNYVVEPRTLQKSAFTPADSLNAWYGTTAAAARRAPTAADWTAAALASPIAHRQEISRSINDGNNRALVLAYANENTQSAASHTPEFMTGLMLRAEYLPGVIYADAALTQTVATGEPQTFWRFMPVGPTITEAQCLYFSNLQAATDYKTAYLAEPAHAGETAEVQCYEGGLCYYNIWVRHANDFPDEPGLQLLPMAYGIVRNNIYRIGLSFTGPGTPKPQLRQPDEISARIFVRRWNLRPQQSILM